LIIADEKGDWGFPSPYLHDRRGPGYVLMSLVFDSLVWKDSQGAFVPALAESWSLDAAGATFSIHPEARWHDGRPVTADDVVFTVEMFRAYPYLSLDLSTIRTVRKTDDRTVRFEFEHPFAPFLANIAGMMPIVPRHIFEPVGNPLTLAGEKAAIGSGPFTLVRYDRVQGATLFRANPAYHLGAPRIHEIAFVRMSPPAAVAGLEKGTVGLATNVPVRQVDALKAAGVRMMVHDMGHPVRLKFNHERPALADARARRGLAQFIDRPRIIETAYLGWGEVWDPRGCAPLADPADDPLPFDPEAGQRLLLGAGWQQDDDGAWTLPSAFDLIALRSYDGVARLVTQQLETQGVSVSLTLLDRGAFDDRLRRGSYDLALTSYGMLGDPDVFRHGVLGTRPGSDRYTDDPALVEALMAQTRETDPDKRAALLAQAGERYLQALPSFAMVSPRRVVGVAADVPVFFTPGGLAHGIPSVLNKRAFLP